jgi:hypothetical protein
MMIVEDSCTILQSLETGDAETSEEAAMDSMNRPPSERGARRAQTGRDDLAERGPSVRTGSSRRQGGSVCSAIPRPPRRTTASPRPPFA